MDLKERIKNTTYHQIARYSITSVTMDMIAKECGISKRTLYETFPDKRSLIIESIKSVFEERNQAFQEELEKSENKMVGMLRIHSLIREFMSSVSLGFFIDMHRLYPQLKSEYQYLQNERISYFQTILEEGKKEGVFRANMDSFLIANLYFMQLQTIKDAQELYFKEKSPVKVYDVAFLIFFRGISTPKGLEIIEKYCETNKL